MAESSGSGKAMNNKSRIYSLTDAVDSSFLEQFNRNWELFKGASKSSRRSRQRSKNDQSSMSQKNKNDSCISTIAASQSDRRNTRSKKSVAAESLEMEFSMDSGFASSSSRISWSSTHNSQNTMTSESSQKRYNLRQIGDRRIEKSCANQNDDNKITKEVKSKRILEKSRKKSDDASWTRSSETDSRLDEIWRKKRHWLETHETDGSWVQCCDKKCGKWRLLVEYEDPAEVPEIWFCSMNSDPDFASCEIPEEEIPLDVRDELIETEYHVGSIVWARLDGFPWITAIVDECPNFLRWCLLDKSSLIPIKYHVVFLNSEKLERAWIRTRDLKAYVKNSKEAVVKKIKFRGKNFTREVNEACELANEAVTLSISERLQRFGWAARTTEKSSKVGKSQKKKRSINFVKNVVPLSRLEEDSQRKTYKVGDIVWAHPTGFPWFPAMIDTCPIHKSYYKFPESPREPIEFHVVYFIEKRLEIDWLPERCLKLFAKNPKSKVVKRTKCGKKDYKRDINEACELARVAQGLSLTERMKRFSLEARQAAMLSEPPKKSRQNETEVLTQNSGSLCPFLSSDSSRLSGVWDSASLERKISTISNPFREGSRSSSRVELSDWEPELLKTGELARRASEVSSPTCSRYLSMSENFRLTYDERDFSDLNSNTSRSSSNHCDSATLANEIAGNLLEQGTFFFRKQRSSSYSSPRNENDENCYSPMSIAPAGEYSVPLLYGNDSMERDAYDDVSMYDMDDDEKKKSESAFVLLKLFN